MVVTLTIMVLFLLVNLYIGFRGTKKITSSSFMTGDRGMSIALVAFSTFASSVGAGDTFSYPSLGFTTGWSSLHFIWAQPVVIILMAFTVGRIYYESNVKTISDMLCKTYGEDKMMRVVSSFCMAFGIIFWCAQQYSAFGRTLNLMTGLPSVAGVLIGALIFISYTVAGGLSSVMAVSLIQGILMIIGIVIIFFIAMAQGGGYGPVMEKLPADYTSLVGTGGIMTIMMYYVTKGVSRFTNFTYWQRLGAAKSWRGGVWGVAIGMFMTAIIGWLLCGMGMAYKIAKPDLVDPEMVFVDASLLYLPNWLVGIVVGALWAAILSSAGGYLNAATTIISNDIMFKGFWKEPTDEKKRLLTVRLVTVFIGVFTFFLARWIPSVLRLSIVSGVWLTAAVMPVLYAMIFDRKGKLITPGWLTASIAISAIVGIAFELHPVLKVPFAGGSIPTLLVSMIVVFIGTVMSKNKAAA